MLLACGPNSVSVGLQPTLEICFKISKTTCVLWKSRPTRHYDTTREDIFKKFKDVIFLGNTSALCSLKFIFLAKHRVIMKNDEWIV